MAKHHDSSFPAHLSRLPLTLISLLDLFVQIVHAMENKRIPHFHSFIAFEYSCPDGCGLVQGDGAFVSF
jgi:hypothetical protein